MLIKSSTNEWSAYTFIDIKILGKLTIFLLWYAVSDKEYEITMIL